MATDVKSILHKFGFMHAWECAHLIGNPNIFVHSSKQRVQDNFIQSWFAAIGKSSTLLLFIEIKSQFKYEDYLSFISSRPNRIA